MKKEKRQNVKTEFDEFSEGYEMGKRDAASGKKDRKIVDVQKVGHAFGFVGELDPVSAYHKWASFGKPT